MENLLDPNEMSAKLRQWGATVAAQPYFGGESRGGWVRLLDTVLRNTLPAAWSLRMAAGFRVYAKKSVSTWSILFQFWTFASLTAP